MPTKRKAPKRRRSKRKTRLLVPYPEELNRPTRGKSLVLAALLAKSDDPHWKDRWLAGIRAPLMLDLLRHYKIDRKLPDPWLSLAYRLACDHVPAFMVTSKRGPGRPRNAKPLAAVREKEWTDERQQELLTFVRIVAKREGYTGRGAIRKVLTDALTDGAKENGKSVTAVLARSRRPLQVAYSRAKRKFPDLA